MNIWVNGTFDVMHLGHIRLLEFASTFGKVRVGLDTDERIRDRKGLTRPFNRLEERVEFISSIKFVDSVVSFGSDEELREKIKEYSTDIIVVGEEYKEKEVIGLEFAKQVLYFPKLNNKSTTEIFNYEYSSDWGKVF
jgi:D-beta-D-heptose 7-phosphate kinase/D-beta-D-heptose 1-phosphate adenosyltransferase